MARKKEYTVIAKYTPMERTSDTEEKIQQLFDRIAEELLNKYPHLLDDLEKSNDDVKESK